MYTRHHPGETARLVPAHQGSRELASDRRFSHIRGADEEIRLSRLTDLPAQEFNDAPVTDDPVK
jgi:hypothetical protein